MTNAPQENLTVEDALVRAVTHHQAGQFAEAENLYRAILQFQPDQSDANHNLGLLAGQLGHTDAGLPYLKAALESHPNQWLYSLSYAKALLHSDQLTDAKTILKQAKQRGMDSAEAEQLLVQIYDQLHSKEMSSTLILQQKQNEVTENNFLQTVSMLNGGDIETASAHAKIHISTSATHKDHQQPPSKSKQKPPSQNELNRLIALFNANQFEELEQQATTLLDRFPHSGFVWKVLGTAQQAQGKAALMALQKAANLLPTDAEVHSNLAVVLNGERQFDRAIESCRRALKVKPLYAEAENNWGTALKELGQLEKAVEKYQKAIKVKPNYAEAHSNLGLALIALGHTDKAIASYRRSLQLHEQNADVHGSLGNALKDIGQLDVAVASYRRALALKPDARVIFDNLLFTQLYQPHLSAAELSVEWQRFDQQFCQALHQTWTTHNNSKQADRKLKIAYVSADLRAHAVATFIEPILTHHDKASYEVYCYYNHRQIDKTTERLRGLVDHWITCDQWNDVQLAQQIHDDGIDLLIDLSGHTNGNRLLTFARKPAPVQLTYLGYPGSSGLEAMDYRITDHYADSEGSDVFYREKLLRLPTSLWCYQPAVQMPEISELPAKKNGFITFGSFNSSNKIDQESIILWANLLLALPTARLVMVTIPEGERRQSLIEQFTSLGVSHERVTFYAALPAAEFHQLLGTMDLTLDPLHVNGATTTCESLWMGVPVMTVVGERFLSRAGYSILKSCGLEKFVARSHPEFIQLAQTIAADVDALAQLRGSMRQMLKNTPVVDGAQFTKNYETLLRSAWREWCVG